MRATMRPVLPVALARCVNWSSRPLARRRFDSVRSSASSVSSSSDECSSSSSATRNDKACWREMADESESSCVSWSARRRDEGGGREGGRAGRGAGQHEPVRVQRAGPKWTHLRACASASATPGRWRDPSRPRPPPSARGLVGRRAQGSPHAVPPAPVEEVACVYKFRESAVRSTEHAQRGERDSDSPIPVVVLVARLSLVVRLDQPPGPPLLLLTA